MFRALCIGVAAAMTMTACAQTSGPEGEAAKVPGMHTFTAPFRGKAQPWVVHVPEGYTDDEAWPLIVALHGMGERGSDGEMHKHVGIGPAIQANPERFPCLVVMPQCPDDSFWGSVPGEERFKHMGDASPFIDTALNETLERYNVDRSRIVLTGLSMGGYGTFIYGAGRTDVYAAFVPVCGRGLPDDAEKLAQRPMRIFHGGADDVVPAEHSKTMYEAIKEAGGDVQLTIFEGVGHNSWDPTYRDPAVIRWMLDQRLPVADDAAPSE